MRISILFILLLTISACTEKGYVEVVEHRSKCYSGEKTGIFILNEENMKKLVKIVAETPDPCYSLNVSLRDKTAFINIERKQDICIQCIGVQEVTLKIENIKRIVVSVDGKEVFKYGK